jgi:hypothetical protein
MTAGRIMRKIGAGPRNHALRGSAGSGSLRTMMPALPIATTTLMSPGIEPSQAAHRLIVAAWRSLVARPRPLPRWRAALIGIDEADLSEQGCRLRREALFEVRDRQRCQEMSRVH